ncbi:MAG: phosphoribosylformylglycinamidine cyclo-ligase [Candidatus Dadabacteria bacterium]|nr:phosphoribosylformylglycinamidine cyclo-ligase [Candidatus Dadabacteria bacterium]NIQ13898.1 phosphoribosylformylglycinamidine cyclo-ligase [Candidatus Dadabacteria bacterium]
MSKTTYKGSGVDISEGNRFVELIKPIVKSTHNENLLGSLGGFAGAFSLDLKGINKPLLVSATDGVGTKLKVSFLTNKYDTIGIDLVAMCVNDIITCGAKPLFFLDYFSTSKLNSEQASEVIKGIAKGCVESGCVLIGGETAEMPGFYKEGEFDLAGFSVGLVDQDKYINGSKVREGDIVIGISSSGLHSNGFSLARKALFEIGGFNHESVPEGFDIPIGEELLKPTRIYVRTVLELIEKFNILSIAHITGGGLLENIPRVIPSSCSVKLDSKRWKLPRIMELIMSVADIELKEMYRTFNCGIGLVLIVSSDQAEDIISYLNENGEDAFVIGEVVENDKDRERVIIS